MRYDAPLEPRWTRQVLGEELDAKRLRQLAALDDDRQAPALSDIGRRAGEARVRREHFADAFDVKD